MALPTSLSTQSSAGSSAGSTVTGASYNFGNKPQPLMVAALPYVALAVVAVIFVWRK